MADQQPSPLHGPRRDPAATFRLVAMGALALVVLVIGVRVLTDPGVTEVPLPEPAPLADGGVEGGAIDGVPTEAPPSERPPKEDPADAISPELQSLIDEGLPVYCGGGNLPLVALTFDDGPGVLSQETIDVLRERDATATFFLVGKFMKSPDFIAIAKDEAETFEIANHSQNHFGLAGASTATLETEIVKPERLIEKATGEHALFFRPPWGSRDDALHRFVQDQGMIEVIWSLDSLDSKAGTNTEDIIRALDKGLSPGDIVLMHENRGTTRNAVPAILDMLEDKGLTAVTLSELLTQDPPSRKQLKSASCS